MRKLTGLIPGCLLVLIAASLCAGQSSTPQPQLIPAATFSQFQCTGFISDERVSDAIRVYNGADNDIYEELHTFTPGDLVYLSGDGERSFHVGEALSLVRPETGFFLSSAWLPGMIENQILPPASNYKHQRIKIKGLGYPYNNTGLVRVVKVTPEGAIAKVIFACTAVNPQDIAVPYVPQPIPEYVPNVSFNRYAPPDGKLQGAIVGASAASQFLAAGSIAFLNIGQNEGVEPGQRYRIFYIGNYGLSKGLESLKRVPKTPRETLGELIILRTQGKSSVGIVVDSLREIAVGDGVELE